MSEPPERKDFNRPWEEGSADDDDTGRVVPLPGLGEEIPETPETPDDDDEGYADESPSGVTVDDGSDEIDWLTMEDSDLEITPDNYATASTEEYRGLAEEVSRAAETKWEQQAVAASLPGVESGLVGFEDVSGRRLGSEEEYEALEQAATSDLAMRIGSGVVIFGLFLGTLLLGGWWFTSFVILVMVVALGELYATLRTKGYKPLALFGLLGVILMGAGAHGSGVPAIGTWGVVAAATTILFVSLAPRRRPLEDASVTVLGLAWVGMLAFAIPIARGPSPLEHIVFIVLVVALNDIGAFFVGRAFGKKRLAPLVSPKKTVEGFFGGLILGAIAASVMVSFPAWEPIGLANGLILAAIIGVVSPIGDLAESMVKRTIDVKDMGSVLPGHGGMLDRVDGLLFVLPAVYFAFRAFGLL
jgi:phosphatidate cytidylyltransferase